MSMVMGTDGMIPVNAVVDNAVPDAMLRNIAQNYYAGLASGALIPSRDGALADFFPAQYASLASQYAIGDAPRSLADQANIYYADTLSTMMPVSAVNNKMSIGERAAELAALPINQKGTMSTGGGGFGTIQGVGGPGLPALPAGGAGGFWGQLGQAVLKVGVEKGTEWITNKVGDAFGLPEQGGPPALPTAGSGKFGGQGGINLPQSGSPGNTAPGGVVFVPGKGWVLRRTVQRVQTIDRRGHVDKYGNFVLNAPRMNVLNPHALHRAMRRVTGFHHVAAQALKFMGYHVSGHAKPLGKKRRKR